MTKRVVSSEATPWRQTPRGFADSERFLTDLRVDVRDFRRMINLKYLFPTLRHLAGVIKHSQQQAEKVVSRCWLLFCCCCCLVRLPFKTQRALHTEMYDTEQEEKSYGNVCREGGGGQAKEGGRTTETARSTDKGERGHADIIKRLLTI